VRFAQIVPGSRDSIHARFESALSPPKLFGLFRTQSFGAIGQDASRAYNERFDDTWVSTRRGDVIQSTQQPQADHDI
jgi:hypothetical protein